MSYRLLRLDRAFVPKPNKTRRWRRVHPRGTPARVSVRNKLPKFEGARPAETYRGARRLAVRKAKETKWGLGTYGW